MPSFRFAPGRLAWGKCRQPDGDAGAVIGCHCNEAAAGEEKAWNTVIRTSASRADATSTPNDRPNVIIVAMAIALGRQNVKIFAFLPGLTTPGGTYLHAAPMFHLVDAWSVWSMPLLGATQVMVHFTPEKMMEVVQRTRPTGAGVTRYVLLHGLVQHHAYHAGQIAILARIC